MPRRLSRQLASLGLACAAITGAAAAELGDAKINSHIGQQVVADIELTSLDNAATPVQARLASIDVYRGASLDMAPVLSSLNMNVMRRDGKQFLHITSIRPVEADHLHVYVELTEAGRKSVRLVTLWFTPDPTPPAPPPVLAPQTTPVPAPAAAQPTARTPQPARTAQPARTPAPARISPSAGISTPAPAAKAASEPVAPMLNWVAPPVRPAVVRLPKAKAPPACSKQPAETESACTALDLKNAELRAQIAKLEARVNSLRAATPVEAPAAAAAKPVLPPAAAHDSAASAASAAASAAANAATAPAAASAPEPGPVAATAPPTEQPAREASRKTARKAAAVVAAELESGMPWGWIAGAGLGVFLLIAALQLLRRRKPKGTVTVPLKAPDHEEEQVEPTLG
jgi:hypothetical protein